MKAARSTVFWSGTVAVIAVTVVLLHEILLPFVAGIALAYLLHPVVNRIERIGVNRTVAALGIVGLVIAGAGVLIA
ncbi:MAG: AI-2E family transporter, partial [Methylocella sp.]